MFLLFWLFCTNIGNIANSSTVKTRSKIFAEVSDAHEVSVSNVGSELICCPQNCLFRLMMRLSWTKIDEPSVIL